MSAARRTSRLEDVRREMAEGQHLRALQRLRDMARSRPHDAEVRDLLGLACFEAGDRLEAGRHWFLSPRQDALSAEAAALVERASCGSATAMARFLRLPSGVQGHASDEIVRARLDRLRGRLLNEGVPEDAVLRLMSPPPEAAGMTGWSALTAKVSLLGCMLAAILVTGVALGLVIAIARAVAGALS